MAIYCAGIGGLRAGILGDAMTTILDLRRAVHNFVNERDWYQFHSPKNLSMSIAIEAGELMECLQWQPGNEAIGAIGRQIIIDELADVIIYCLAMANAMHVHDLGQAIYDKIEDNGAKYPADEFKGRYK